MGGIGRLLLGIGVAGLAVLASPALAADEGVRISIQLPSGELPDPEALIDTLSPGGGERRVMVKRQANASTELVIELTGATPPAAEIPDRLRAAHPALATADIQVSAIDASNRLPEPDGTTEVSTTTGPDGKVRHIVKTRKVEVR